MRCYRSKKEWSLNSECVRVLKLSAIQLLFCHFRANDEPWIDTGSEVGAPVLTGRKRRIVTDCLPRCTSNNAIMQATSPFFALNLFDNIVFEICEFFTCFYSTDCCLNKCCQHTKMIWNRNRSDFYIEGIQNEFSMWMESFYLVNNQQLMSLMLVRRTHELVSLCWHIKFVCMFLCNQEDYSICNKCSRIRFSHCER